MWVRWFSVMKWCLFCSSCTSSRAESVDSLLGTTPIMSSTIANLSGGGGGAGVGVDTTACAPVQRPPVLCVNTASVFDLQTLPGFSQEVAANIVHYRNRHGHFTSLDQLIKVRPALSYLARLIFARVQGLTTHFFRIQTSITLPSQMSLSILGCRY